MITKPFLDRFKSSHHSKPQGIDPTANEKLLLKFLSFSVTLDNDNETLLKIARILSYNLEAATVCISQVHDNKAQLRQIFHQGKSLEIDDEKWQINTLNAVILDNTNQETFKAENWPPLDDLPFENSKASILLGSAALNETGNVSAIINTFYQPEKAPSYCENELTNRMAQRVALFFRHEEHEAKKRAKNQPNKKSALNQKLSQVTEQLTATTNSLESLSFAVSHELRAPLRSMDSFSKVLVDDFSHALPEEAADCVNRIRKASLRMGIMIDDLLWLSKVTRRKLDLQDVDLSKLARKVGDELITNEQAVEENKRNIELIIQSNLSVNADKGLMKVTLQHLLSNALKFSRNQNNTVIEFSANQQGSSLVYAISDNGSGFDMAYHEQLFEPFKQLHSSGKFSGTGIGLTTVERIIDRHHGKIWAESDTDDGAVFFFTLPNE